MVLQAEGTTKVNALRWECAQLLLELPGSWEWSKVREGENSKIKKLESSGRCCGEVKGRMDQGWLRAF